MLVQKDINQTSFTQVSTERLIAPSPAPHFTEIAGQPVLLITGISQVPLFYLLENQRVPTCAKISPTLLKKVQLLKSDYN